MQRKAYDRYMRQFLKEQEEITAPTPPENSMHTSSSEPNISMLWTEPELNNPDVAAHIKYDM